MSPRSSTERVPDAVRRSAAQARLGRLLALDQAPSPARAVAARLVWVVAAVVLGIVLSGLVRNGASGALRYVALLALFLAFVPFSRALRDLVVGARTTCVHERGVALGTRRSAVPLTWRGTRGVQRLRAAGPGGTLLGWDLLGRDDRTHRVLLAGRPQQRAELATALEASAHRAGVRITEQQ